MKEKPVLTALKQQAVDSFQRFLSGGDFPAYPLEIFLEVSNVCNMKCAMCSVFSELNPKRLLVLKSSDRGFMPDDHLAALDSLLSHALLVHCFGYGEPTIHPRFAELLDFLLDKEVLVDFFTNGMNLTPELCRFLVDRSVFRITVSFSGATKDDYENMYLDGRYETVLAGIERIAQLKAARGGRYPLIEINSIAFQHHVDRLPTFVEQMAARGVDTIYLKPLHMSEVLPELHSHAAVMRPWHEGKLIAEAERVAAEYRIHFVDEFSNVTRVGAPEQEAAVRRQLLWGDKVAEVAVPLAEFKSLARAVQPIRPPKGNEVGTRRVTAMDQTPETIRPFLKLRALDTPPGSMCYEPFKTLYVNQQGAIRPCCFGFTEAHLGHLDAHPAEAIWNGIGFNTVRKAISNGRYPMQICKACLQQKSYPKHLNFRGMVDAYASWLKAVSGQTFISDASFSAQLFVDTGSAFNEAESVIQPIVPDRDQVVEFDVSCFAEIKSLRFDPFNAPARVVVSAATAIGERGEQFPLALSPLNGTMTAAGEMQFDTDDPQVHVEGFPASGCRKLIVSLRCCLERPGQDDAASGSDMAVSSN